MSVNSEWSDEVLFPTANAVGYRLIFEAETWLRRICWTALLLSEGYEWAATLDDRLRKNLERQSRSNSSRWYLGVDAEEELLWSTTHGQLAELLRMESIQNDLRRVCGVNGEVLSQRLVSVSQVRNTLAHNRAISEDTLTVLRGDITVIRSAAVRFKMNTLYSTQDFAIQHPDEVGGDDGHFLQLFEDMQQAMFTRHGQQLYVGTTRDYFYLIRLPVQPCGWLDGRKLRGSLGLAAKLILCVLANKSGDEMQIVIPRHLPLDDKLVVLDRFMTTDLLIDAWTDVPFEEQDSAYSCWPRLWFYENQTPHGH